MLTRINPDEWGDEELNANNRRVLEETFKQDRQEDVYPALDAVMTIAEVLIDYQIGETSIRMAINTGRLKARQTRVIPGSKTEYGIWLIERWSVDKIWGARKR